MESRKRSSGTYIVILVAAQLALFVSAQGCLQAAGKGATLIRQDNATPPLPSRTQAIIISFKFGCCGNITTWQAYVQPGGDLHQGDYDITFQVWRPSLTLQENGCYSMVGYNRYTSIHLGDHGLVSVTPEPSNILTVQPGDMVGYFTDSREGKGDGGIQLDVSQENNKVWFHTNTASEPIILGAPDCPYPVGFNGSLDSYSNGAPVISVEVSSFSCQPTFTVSPSVSSSGPPSVVATNPSIPSTVPSNTKSMSLPSASPTSALPIGIVAGVMAMLVLSMLVVMVVVLLLWWRKRSQKYIKSEAAEKVLDLSNPNYNFSSSSVRKHQNSKKQQNSPATPPYQSPPTPLGVLDMYESIDNKNPVNNMYPMAPLAGSSSHTYTYITATPRKGEAGESADITFPSDDDTLSHTVGPNGREWTRNDGSVTVSTPPPPRPSPVLARNGTADELVYHILEEAPPPHPHPVPVKDGSGHEVLYHILEETPATHPPVLVKSSAVQEVMYHILEEAPPTCPSLGNSPVLYEAPTLPKFRQRDSAKQNGPFESTGYYVPTVEQRKAFGLNYEQQYESTYAAYDKLNFFEEDQIYWAPATTASGLYSQLASKRYREIQRDQISIMELLGSGQFGEVCKALWTVGGHTLDLAVKTLKPGASEEDKVKFLQEAAIMGQFSHPNVIKMYGIVTLGEPVLICLEILTNGDLRSYLQGLKLRGSKHGDFLKAQMMFLKFAKDIAAGMDYLSKKNFIHRDIAARNILLNKSLTCKVADFGMARDLMDDTYYTSSGGKIPLKWTAPEALLYKKYSADSDVWSYGMVLFEIWSVAKKPFSTVSSSQFTELIQTGFCQAPPPGCPRAIYELMVDCWNPDHSSRPTFSKICSSYLQQSTARILHWSPEDDTLSPAVGVCGALLGEAHKLHLDLQKKYKHGGKIF